MVFLSFILQIIVGILVIRYVLTPIISKHDYMRFVFPAIIYLFITWLNDSSLIGVIAAIVSYFTHSFIENFNNGKRRRLRNEIEKRNSLKNAESNRVDNTKEEAFDILLNSWLESGEDLDLWDAIKQATKNDNTLSQRVEASLRKHPQPKPTVTRCISNTEGFQLMVNKVTSSIVRYSDTEWMHYGIKCKIELLKNHLLEISNDIEYDSHIAVDQLDNGVYFGEKLNGKRHGFGCYMFSNGTVIFGQWSKGEKNGDCIYADGKGYVEYCTYKQNKRVSETYIRYSSGKTENKWRKD